MTNVEFHYFCGHEQFQPEVLVDHAVLAEKAGFDGVFVSEHFHPWVDDVGAAGYAFSTLAAMAQATERVRLITGVIAPIFRHHPAIVAQAAATIDRISGGRFELGIGTGENINEGPLGFSFGNFSERIGRIREAIHIIRALFAGEKDYVRGPLLQHRIGPPLQPAASSDTDLDGRRATAIFPQRRPPCRRHHYQREGPRGHTSVGRHAGECGRGRGRSPAACHHRYALVRLRG